MFRSSRLVSLPVLLLTLACSSPRRISGDIFATDAQGHVWPAAGADILVFASQADELNKFTISLEQKRNRGNWHETQAGTDVDFKTEGSYCYYLWHGGFLYYFGSPESTTSANRDGHFVLKGPKGKHLIYAAGQAGNRCAVWADEINLGWQDRTIQLPYPLCTYKAESEPAHSC